MPAAQIFHLHRPLLLRTPTPSRPSLSLKRLSEDRVLPIALGSRVARQPSCTKRASPRITWSLRVYGTCGVIWTREHSLSLAACWIHPSREPSVATDNSPAASALMLASVTATTTLGSSPLR